MVKLKSVFFVVLTLAVTLSLEFLGNPALSVPYTPPTRKPPEITVLGGSRGAGVCADSNQKIQDIIPLIPDYLSPPKPGENQAYYGLTLSEYPTLFVYVPKTNAQRGELVLQDKNNKLVIRTQFSLP